MIITRNVVFSEWDRIFKDPHDHRCRDRPPGAPLGDPGDDGNQRPRWRRGTGEEGGATTTTGTTTTTRGKQSAKEVDGGV